MTAADSTSEVVYVHGLWMPGVIMSVLRHRLQNGHGFPGREFTYHSDLDLIFLYAGGTDAIDGVSRVGHRLERANSPAAAKITRKLLIRLILPISLG